MICTLWQSLAFSANFIWDLTFWDLHNQRYLLFIASIASAREWDFSACIDSLIDFATHASMKISFSLSLSHILSH